MLTNVKPEGRRYVKFLCIGKKAEVCPQPPEANGGSGAELPTLRQFYSSYFPKNTHFLGIF